MDWSHLDTVADIISGQREDIKAFLTIANTQFKDPDFNLLSFRIEENSVDKSLLNIVLRYSKDWQGTLDQLNSLRGYNRSRITQLRLIPKEDPNSSYIHVEWSKRAVVKAVGSSKRKLVDDGEERY